MYKFFEGLDHALIHILYCFMYAALFLLGLHAWARFIRIGCVRRVGRAMYRATRAVARCFSIPIVKRGLQRIKRSHCRLPVLPRHSSDCQSVFTSNHGILSWNDCRSLCTSNEDMSYLKNIGKQVLYRGGLKVFYCSQTDKITVQNPSQRSSCNVVIHKADTANVNMCKAVHIEEKKGCKVMVTASQCEFVRVSYANRVFSDQCMIMYTEGCGNMNVHALGKVSRHIYYNPLHPEDFVYGCNTWTREHEQTFENSNGTVMQYDSLINKLTIFDVTNVDIEHVHHVEILNVVEVYPCKCASVSVYDVNMCSLLGNHREELYCVQELSVISKYAQVTDSFVKVDEYGYETQCVQFSGSD